jgi:uncharacterized membrane protein
MVKMFKHDRFVDKDRVREAVDAAERTTSAPIHVTIAPYFWGSVRRTAERAFHKLRLDQTAQRNGVLFFVVPARREFAVIGDTGAHQAIGQTAWDAVAALVEEHFRAGDPTIGLVHGIEAVARELAEHFPPSS